MERTITTIECWYRVKSDEDYVEPVPVNNEVKREIRPDLMELLKNISIFCWRLIAAVILFIALIFITGP